ncbi:hypothetical protein [Streptomyces sp. NPDC056491]|uniref:hypothetical protein n=1 Tax=Streptomyces sp. NPDC056491 TaxID=3345837 RepID=UPI0036ADB3FC
MVTCNAVVSAADVKAVAGARLDQSGAGVLALVSTFPVAAGALVVAARSDLRRPYLRRALRPLGAVAAVMASMGTSALAMTPEPAGLRDAVGLPGKIALGVLCLWSIGFALHGIVLSLVHVFRTADIHQVVPPVLAGVLVWEMASWTSSRAPTPRSRRAPGPCSSSERPSPSRPCPAGRRTVRAVSTA